MLISYTEQISEILGIKGSLATHFKDFHIGKVKELWSEKEIGNISVVVDNNLIIRREDSWHQHISDYGLTINNSSLTVGGNLYLDHGLHLRGDKVSLNVGNHLFLNDGQILLFDSFDDQRQIKAKHITHMNGMGIHQYANTVLEADTLDIVPNHHLDMHVPLGISGGTYKVRRTFINQPDHYVFDGSAAASIGQISARIPTKLAIDEFIVKDIYFEYGNNTGIFFDNEKGNITIESYSNNKNKKPLFYVQNISDSKEGLYTSYLTGIKFVTYRKMPIDADIFVNKLFTEGGMASGLIVKKFYYPDYEVYEDTTQTFTGHVFISEITGEAGTLPGERPGDHVIGAVGVLADAAKFEGGLTIKDLTVTNEGRTFAVLGYAKYGNHNGVTILDPDSTIGNQIEGDIASVNVPIVAGFEKNQSYLKGQTFLQDESSSIDLTFSNSGQWLVTGNSAITNLTLKNDGIIRMGGSINNELSSLSKDHAHKLSTNSLQSNDGILHLRIDFANGTEVADKIEVNGNANGTFGVRLDVFNAQNQPSDLVSKSALLTQLGGTLDLTKVIYQPGGAGTWSLGFISTDGTISGGNSSLNHQGGWHVMVGNNTNLKPDPEFKPEPNPAPEPNPNPTPEPEPEPEPEPNPGPLPDPNPEPEPKPEPSPEPNPGPVPEPNPEPTPDSKPDHTPEVDQVLSLGTSVTQALGMLAETEDLRMRMGDVRHGDTDGLWVRTYSRKDSARGSFGNGFEQDVHGFHIGADHVIRTNSNASWLLGGAFHYGKSDIEGAAEAGGGDADIDQYTFKAYATYMKDNGAFADIVLHTGYYDTTLTGKDNTGLGSFKGDYSNWGYGVSAEVGHRIDLSSFANNWYVEPKAQLTWFHAEGKNFKTSTGLEINQGDADFITGRLGAAVGKVFALGTANDPMSSYFSVAMKGGMLYQFDGDQTITAHGTDGATVVCADTMDMKGARAYYGITADWKIDNTWRIYGQISREEGSGYTKDYDASIGVRYAF